MFNINWSFFLWYILLFLVTWWLYIGYLIFIFLRSSIENNEKESLRMPYPTIALLIPCYNEEEIIEKKIKNTLALNYPKEKLKIIFIDGRSTDNTISIIKKYMKKNVFIKIMIAKRNGKIHQLNEVLPMLHDDIIVCTDADGILQQNALITIASYLQNKKVGLVGIKIEPCSQIPEEVYFWEQQNRLRLAESKYYSPLYLIAVCYGFRKGLIEKFPEDVIADDIYLSFFTIKKGLRVVYTEEATAQELRSPSTFSQLFHHKIRKTNAFLIEIFRFFPIFLFSPIRWQLIFYTRAAQILIAPFFLIALGIILLYTSFTSLTGILPFLTIFSLIFTYLIFRPIAFRGLFKKIKTFIFVEIVILYSLFTYFFYKQTSSYKKIKLE